MSALNGARKQLSFPLNFSLELPLASARGTLFIIHEVPQIIDKKNLTTVVSKKHSLELWWNFEISLNEFMNVKNEVRDNLLYWT